MITLAGAKKLVDAELENYCDDKLGQAAALSPDYAELWQVLKDYLLGGGKRLRPYLVLLSYEMYGGQQTEQIVKVAAAWEILHACLLIHDDIIDRDLVRHGRPNIAGSYQVRIGDEHLAMSAALIAGDLALSAAYELVTQSNLTLDAKEDIYKLLQRTVHTVAGGEFLDTMSVLSNFTSIDTDAINLSKTASYSFTSPLQAGATLAGASNDEIAKLAELGRELGLDYQLSDDLLGVLGDESQTGKSASSDLREGKRTLLLQLTVLSSADTDDLLDIISKGENMTDSDIVTIKEAMKTSGAVNKVHKIVHEHTAKAQGTIRDLQISPDYKNELRNLAQKLESRLA